MMCSRARRNRILIGVAFAWLTLAYARPSVGEPAPVVNQDQLKTGLMDVLGDAFEFVSGEVGRVRSRVGSHQADYFWFAKVRAKAAGDYAISYSATFQLPDGVAAGKTSASYLMPIRVGKVGDARLLRATYGSVWAHPCANVGDVLLIPIHSDRYLSYHVFGAVPDDAALMKALVAHAGRSA
jgi:hypothetical protein